MKKVLIVKTSALGDIVQTYPVISYLRQKFCGISIDWVVEKDCAHLVSAHPGVDQVFCISTKEWRRAPFSSRTWKSINDFRKSLQQHVYDAVFDLQGNIKSGLVVAQARSHKKVGFGSQSVAEWPNLLFTRYRFNPSQGLGIREGYLDLVAAFCGDQEGSLSLYEPSLLNIDDSQRSQISQMLHQVCFPGKPLVVVSSGSAWPNKQVNIETLASFLDSVCSYLNCSFLFLWGSQKEQEAAMRLHAQFKESSHVVDKMSLPMLQHVMKEAAMVIAMDSLPLHLAGTTTTPTFSMFGPSSAAKYKPTGAHHFAFQGACPYGETFKKRCPKLRTCPTGACMKNMTAEDLFRHFMVWQESLARKG